LHFRKSRNEHILSAVVERTANIGSMEKPMP
jgi:hypothetical protein